MAAAGNLEAVVVVAAVVVVDIVVVVVDIVAVVVVVAADIVVAVVEASWEICPAGSSELRALPGPLVDETATIPSFDRTCPWKYHNWLG